MFLQSLERGLSAQGSVALASVLAKVMVWVWALSEPFECSRHMQPGATEQGTEWQAL